jgi:hypothetical protein
LPLALAAATDSDNGGGGEAVAADTEAAAAAMAPFASTSSELGCAAGCEQHEGASVNSRAAGCFACIHADKRAGRNTHHSQFAHVSFTTTRSGQTC